MKTLFLAWQNANTRRWFPVGRLTQDEVTQRYQFAYIRGVEQAQKEGGFRLFPEFPRRKTYTSDELFPLFTNRVMPASRPDFADYVRWLRLEGNEKDPMAFLARTNGKRQTDTLEVFPLPEATTDGGQRTTFFVHGLRHMSPEAAQRMKTLQSGEQLLLGWDVQNPADENAVTLRTQGKPSGDTTLLGYCPRYLAKSVLSILRTNREAVTVKVLSIQPPPAPLQYAIYCELNFPQKSHLPFDEPEFAPL